MLKFTISSIHRCAIHQDFLSNLQPLVMKQLKQLIESLFLSLSPITMQIQNDADK